MSGRSRQSSSFVALGFAVLGSGCASIVVIEEAWRECHPGAAGGWWRSGPGREEAVTALS
ncbi:MAG: hypothetical protein HY744_17120 [Deltaproteobacteria bacterium]|nr:hypothetical protein [Deltaproteobacteria bacterium]